MLTADYITRELSKSTWLATVETNRPVRPDLYNIKRSERNKNAVIDALKVVKTTPKICEITGLSKNCVQKNLGYLLEEGAVTKIEYMRHGVKCFEWSLVNG